jgi:hypothetical protein
MGTLPDALIARAFQQFGYPAALIAFIFVNGHSGRFQSLISFSKPAMLRQYLRIINNYPRRQAAASLNDAGANQNLPLMPMLSI